MDIDEYLFTDVVSNRLAQTVESINNVETLKNLMEWVSVAVKYKPDKETYGFDYIQPPSVTVRTGEGDCQDITALIVSVLNLLNIPVRLVCAEVEGNVKHVWIEAMLNNNRYMLDGTNNIFKKLDDSSPYNDIKQIKNIISTTEWV